MNDFLISLYTGCYYMSPTKIESQMDALCPYRIVNENNKIVDYCKNLQEAKFAIVKRNEALILLGRTPKKYKIIQISKNAEHVYLRTKFKEKNSIYIRNNFITIR